MANLKTVFTSDTSNLKKGSQEAKGYVKDFEKVSSDSISKLGDLFGVNTQKVQQLANAARGAAMTISKSLGNSSQAASALATKIGAAAAGVAGISAVGIIASWKELNAEADHFFNSMAGDDLKSGMEAYIATLKAASMEMRNIAESADNVISIHKKWATVTTTIKEAFVGMLGFSASGATGVAGAVSNIVGTLTVGKAAAGEAEKLMVRMGDLGDEIVMNEYKVYELDQKIAEAKRLAKDESESLAARSAAIAEAQTLIKQRTQVLVPIYKELATLQERYNSLTLTSEADQMKVNEYKKQAAMMTKAENDELRMTYKLQKSITNETQKAAAAAAAAAEAAKKEAIRREEVRQAMLELEVMQDKTVTVTPKISEESLEKVHNVLTEFEGVSWIKAVDVVPTLDKESYERAIEYISQINDQTVLVKPKLDNATMESIANVFSQLKDAGVDKAVQITPTLNKTEFDAALQSLYGELDGIESKTLLVQPQIESTALMSGIEQMQAYADANPITLNADVKAKFEDMQMQLANINQQLTAQLQNAVATGLSGLGEAIGAAITGAEEPGAILLNTVATLMKQLGELAIGAGVAMLGIKAALESMNPYAAIAAGVALVALAAVVSSAASNMGSQIGGSSGTTSYTSSYRFGTNGLQSSSAQELRVTGTLKADGDQLVAVLDNTANRNYYTR